MNILVTNDDGINAEGISRLAEALSEVADIYIVAPDRQRSASSQSITLKKPLYIEQLNIPACREGYMTNGTPADCVSIGLKLLETRGIEIDMVFSGINHGSNLGTDTLYSGTVSAALEGTVAGKPSVAVSVDSLHPRYFDTACELAVKAAKDGRDLIPPKTVLNINTPDIPPWKIKGVLVTRLGIRGYEDWLHELDEKDDFVDLRPDGRKVNYKIRMEGGDSVDEDSGRMYYDRVFNNVKYFIYGGIPKFYKGLPNNVDIGAHQNGYATITPLKSDRTDYEMAEKIKDWGVF